MIVVADTSPLNYLIQIECDRLLPELYERILVPVAVMNELAHPGAPALVRAWFSNVPSWMAVQSAPVQPDAGLAFLDIGERQAIQLAEEQRADLVLIDERRGRIEAMGRGLRTTGTLGVLMSAGELRMIDPEVAYRRLLTETNFRTSAPLEAQFLGLIKP